MGWKSLGKKFGAHDSKCQACSLRPDLIQACAFPTAPGNLLGGDSLDEVRLKDIQFDQAEAEAEERRFFSLERLKRFFQSTERGEVDEQSARKPHTVKNVAYALQCSSPCTPCAMWKQMYPPAGSLRPKLEELQNEDMIRLFAALIYLGQPQLIYPLHASNVTRITGVTKSIMRHIGRTAKKSNLTVPGENFCNALQYISYWFEPAQFSSETVNVDDFDLTLNNCRLPLITDTLISEEDKHPGMKYYVARAEHLSGELRSKLEQDYPDAVLKNNDAQEEGKLR
jgi:hypothetical protein